MNYLDIILLVLLGLSVLVGYFKGLIKSLINILAIICSFIISKAFYIKVFDIINERFPIYENIYVFIKNIVNNEGVEAVMNNRIVQALLSKTQLMNLYSDNASISDIIKKVSVSIADKINLLLSMLIVFLGAFIVIVIIGTIVDKIMDTPALKPFNKISGALVGGVKGVLYSMLIVVIIGWIGSIMSVYFVNLLDGSFLGSLFYKYNIFTLIFSSYI